MAIVIMVSMNVIGSPMTTTSAPNGIISFEFAFSPTHAQEILNSWNPDAQMRAAIIQGLDFLFPLVYSLALGLGCILTAEVLQKRVKPLSALGAPLAWGLVLAAICD